MIATWRNLREQLKPLACQRSFEGSEAGDVPAWAAKPLDDAAGDGIGHVRKDDRDRLRLPLEGNDRRGRACHDDIRLQTDQLLRKRSYPIGVITAPTKVRPHVAAIGPTEVRKRLRERRVAMLLLRIVFVEQHEHADPPYAVALLRPRHHRPRRRAAEPRDEMPSLCMTRKEHCEG